MSPFEILMLLCFGAAWPFSIVKSWRSRKTGGKSLFFLVVILVGYLSGITHKLFYRYDPVIFLYCLNAAMVATDMALWFRNRRIERQEAENGLPTIAP